MGEKRFCPNCGTQLGEEDKFCTKCGKELEHTSTELPLKEQSGQQQEVQQPVKKKGGCLKIIGIVMGIIVILFVLIAAFGKTESHEVQTKLETEKETREEVSSTEAESEDVENKINAFTLYSQLQDNDMTPYVLNDKAVQFLKNHNELFPVKSENQLSNKSLINYDLQYKHIAKNPDKYGDKFMVLPDLMVVQIFETDLGDNQYVTEINALDMNGQQFYLFYNGELEDIFEEDAISVVGLPLGISSFDNVDGGQTLVAVLAASYVSKGGFGDKSFSENGKENINAGNSYEEDEIYGTYECHTEYLDAIAEVGWNSDDNTEFIILTGSASDGSSTGEFTGTVVSTKENNYTALDLDENVIDFYYNDVDRITVNDYNSLGGMNFPGFTGTYYKVENLSHIDSEPENMLVDTYVAYNVITGITTTIEISEEGQIHYKETGGGEDFDYYFGYSIENNQIKIHTAGMNVYYDTFNIEPDGNLTYVDMAEEGPFTVWFMKQ